MIKRVCFTAVTAACASVWASSFAASTDWLQFGFDPTHSGINPNETLLTPRNVQYMTLLYSKTFSAPAQGTPVFLSNVATSQGTIDLVFLTLNDGSLLALNAATGAQVWASVASTVPPCAQADQSPQCLVTSSPAIDPNRNFVYNFSRLDGKIHKFAVGTGVETVDAHWPEISTLKPNVEKGSSALTFATSSSDGYTYLYMTASSIKLDDGGDYQGHITAINLTTGTQIVFNAVCSNLGNMHLVDMGATSGANQNDCLKQTFNIGTGVTFDGDAGIWGRAAATYDPADDSIYISTGNGANDPNNSNGFGFTWGDSVLKLPAALKTELFAPLDNYTPPNYMSLMEYDNDLGSTSVAIIPMAWTQDFSYTHLGIQSGKDSNLRILNLDRGNMTVSNGPQQTYDTDLFTLSVKQGNEVKTQPLIWKNPDTGAILVIVSNDFGISAAQLIMDGSHNPQLSYATAASWQIFGSSLSHGTSAGGGSPVIANGVLYYASAGGLVAIDPATGTILTTKTDMGTGASAPGLFHKQSPIVVDNRVYVTDENLKLWVYQGDEIFPNGFD
jgi:hypothetical protein